MGKAFSLISPETGLLLQQEAELLFKSFILGIFLSFYVTLKYSVVKAFKIKGFLLLLIDFTTPAEITVLVFLFSLKYNFGIIRWYIPAFSLAGHLFLKLVCRDILEKALVGLFRLPVVLLKGLKKVPCDKNKLKLN